MRFYIPSIIALSLLAGCWGETGDGANAKTPGSGAAPQVWTDEGFAEARAVYRRACAACHDAGAGNAPSIGDKKAWDGRSRMWVAVLVEHAKQGYLAMPARGGSHDLTDAQVSAAAEYMMAVTYPELPLD